MDRGYPFKVLWILPGQFPAIIIGYIYGAVLGQRSAFLVMGVIECQEHELNPRPQALQQSAHACDIALVDLSGNLVGGTGVEEEYPVQGLEGMEWAFHLWGNNDAAVRITGSGDVGMAIPYLGGIKALPGLPDRGMIGQVRRQGGMTGIPDP